jgi:hypothetical protein
MADRHVCLVCGYGELTESPWSNGSPSDEICPACGTHFGFDDVAGVDPAEREAVYRRRRSEWVANGMALVVDQPIHLPNGTQVRS